MTAAENGYHRNHSFLPHTPTLATVSLHLPLLSLEGSGVHFLYSSLSSLFQFAFLREADHAFLPTTPLSFQASEPRCVYPHPRPCDGLLWKVFKGRHCGSLEVLSSHFRMPHLLLILLSTNMSPWETPEKTRALKHSSPCHHYGH